MKLNKKEFTLRNSKGFTLLEMMVVVAIISIMSMMVINNYNSQRKTKEMQFAVQKVADAIRSAQNYSKNIKKFEGYNISGGYGVHFDSANDSYFIFLDVVKDKMFVSADDVKVETINFPADIYVGSLNGGAANKADVVFQPPFGKVYMSFDGFLQNPTPSLDIEIKRSGETCPDFCKTVTINPQGQIK